MEEFRVVLADFDEDARQSLAEALSSMEDIEVVGQTGEADRVLELVRQQQAQVLILEMALRGGDGLEVLAQIRQTLGDTVRVIACSLFADRALVNGVVQRGADYFMIKPLTAAAVAEHIRLVGMQQEGMEDMESLNYRAAMELRWMGGQPNMKGYNYLIESVGHMAADPDTVCGITKIIYPQIARRHKTSSAAVERSIRHAIGKIWENGNAEELRRLFPDYGPGKKAPSNAVFIAVVAQHISMKGRKWGTGA